MKRCPHCGLAILPAPKKSKVRFSCLGEFTPSWENRLLNPAFPGNVFTIDGHVDWAGMRYGHSPFDTPPEKFTNAQTLEEVQRRAAAELRDNEEALDEAA